MASTPVTIHKARHLSGLAAKIAARKARQMARKSGSGPLNGATYSVAAVPVRSTRAARNEEHRERMVERRKHQRRRESSFPQKLSNGRTLVRVMPTKNNDPAYRKSIWPASKIARRASLANPKADTP